MALEIFQTADKEADPFSQDQTNTNPIRISVDGRVGAVLERLFYVATSEGDDTAYEDITITPVPNPANDIVNGEDGYSIKLCAGSTQPTAQEWDTIEEGNTITVDDILDDLTFVPFWVRIAVPKGAPVDTITGNSLRVNGTAFVPEEEE
jgi:hypothetical protein